MSGRLREWCLSSSDCVVFALSVSAGRVETNRILTMPTDFVTARSTFMAIFACQRSITAAFLVALSF